MQKIVLHSMLESYLCAALWSSNGDDGEPLSDAHGSGDFSPIARLSAQKDCADFLHASGQAGIDVAALPESITSEQMGHDFWLTRNRHGAGFWDRGNGSVGEQLTAVAHAAGSCDAYVGDDGLIYFQ